MGRRDVLVMKALLIGIFLAVMYGSAEAQVLLQGTVSLTGGASAVIGVAPPTVNECDLPMSFAGNQGANCMRTIYKAGVWDKRSQISYGHDLGQQKLTTDFNSTANQLYLLNGSLATVGWGNIPSPGYHTALVMAGANQPLTWVAAYNPNGSGNDKYGDGETCVEIMPTQINGEKGAGPAILITEGANQSSGACSGATDGGAYIFTAGFAKASSASHMESVNLCTGVRTNLATTSLNTCYAYGQSSGTANTSCLDAYAGTLPPGNCNHHQGQVDWHMNCMWTQVCLSVVQSGTTATLTGRVWRIGKAAGWVKADPQNNDPGPPSGTTAFTRFLVSTTVYGPFTRSANIPATGMIGVAGGALTTSTQETAVTNLRWAAP